MRLRRVAFALAVALVACSDKPPAPPGELPGTTYDGGLGGDAKPHDTAPLDDAPPVTVDGYPKAPWGKSRGQVFPLVVLDGYADASSPWGKISTKDLFDPDGKKGIRGVLLVVAAQWCGVCQNEAKWIPGAYESTYKAKGARFVTALIHDRERNPAYKAVADQWRDVFKITFAVAIDPAMETLPFNSGPLSLPYTFVIDPRTMRIEKVTQGALPPPNVPALDEVIARNGG